MVLGGAGLAGIAALAPAAVRTLADLPSSSDWVPGNSDGIAPGEQASCVDAGQLPVRSRIGSARIVYEPTGRATPMRFDPGFAGQLDRWLADWNQTSRHGGVTELWSYGAHVIKDECRSWHANGRAFDISRLRSGDELLVSARTDLWREVSAEQQAPLARGYWALAASLHLHFAYVLTHHFDGAHANHIHVDNGVSVSGMSEFSRRSRVQNQAVQAICQTLWDQPGTVTGAWSDTRAQAGPVLEMLGISDLRRQETWQAFLRASVKHG